MFQIQTSNLFAKNFMCSIILKEDGTDKELTLTRQVLIARSEQVKEGNETINIITHTLDGKRLILSLMVTTEDAEEFVQTFTDEQAQAIAQQFCLKTLDQINQEQSANVDLDLPFIGVE